MDFVCVLLPRVHAGIPKGRFLENGCLSVMWCLCVLLNMGRKSLKCALVGLAKSNSHTYKRKTWDFHYIKCTSGFICQPLSQMHVHQLVIIAVSHDLHLWLSYFGSAVIDRTSISPHIISKTWVMLSCNTKLWFGLTCMSRAFCLCIPAFFSIVCHCVWTQQTMVYAKYSLPSNQDPNQRNKQGFVSWFKGRPWFAENLTVSEEVLSCNGRKKWLNMRLCSHTQCQTIVWCYIWVNQEL